MARGALHHAKGDHDRAIEDFSEAVKRDPKLAAARNGRGACHYAKGEFDKAIADFDAALKIDPKYVSALVNRANA